MCGTGVQNQDPLCLGFFFLTLWLMAESTSQHPPSFPPSTKEESKLLWRADLLRDVGDGIRRERKWEGRKKEGGRRFCLILGENRLIGRIS